MIVIGGYNSSNTCNLARICAEHGADVPHRRSGLPGVGRRDPAPARRDDKPEVSHDRAGCRRGPGHRRPDLRRLDPRQPRRAAFGAGPVRHGGPPEALLTAPARHLPARDPASKPDKNASASSCNPFICRRPRGPAAAGLRRRRALRRKWWQSERCSTSWVSPPSRSPGSRRSSRTACRRCVPKDDTRSLERALESPRRKARRRAPVMQAVDRLEAARGALKQARTMMLLRMVRILTSDQRRQTHGASRSAERRRGSLATASGSSPRRDSPARPAGVGTLFARGGARAARRDSERQAV